MDSSTVTELRRFSHCVRTMEFRFGNTAQVNRTGACPPWLVISSLRFKSTKAMLVLTEYPAVQAHTKSLTGKPASKTAKVVAFRAAGTRPPSSASRTTTISILDLGYK
eukprot:scaffold703_cov168-Amphora_coffeaeformis.AAC.27